MEIGIYTFAERTPDAATEHLVSAEQRLADLIEEMELAEDLEDDEEDTFRNKLDFELKIAPKLTIQGGTTEVLRGIIARGLGLR